MFSLGPAPRPGQVMVLMCVFVCLFVCLSVCPPSLPPQSLEVPLGYLGPLVTFYIPWTFRYLLDTLELYVPFGYIGSLCTLLISWT